jgi:hypothetical protein
MLTIMVATAFALGLACAFLMTFRTADPAQLQHSHAELLRVGVQIICGNCSGEDGHPVKTYMDRSGSCAHCGGNSYLLASAVAANSVVLRQARLLERQIASSNGRVIPFEAHASRGSRSERIAV